VAGRSTEGLAMSAQTLIIRFPGEGVAREFVRRASSMGPCLCLGPIVYIVVTQEGQRHITMLAQAMMGVIAPSSTKTPRPTF
jgi:hypothetical protein